MILGISTCSASDFNCSLKPYLVCGPVARVLDRPHADEGKVMGVLRAGDVAMACDVNNSWIKLPAEAAVRCLKMPARCVKLQSSAWIFGDDGDCGQILVAHGAEEVMRYFCDGAFKCLPFMKTVLPSDTLASNAVPSSAAAGSMESVRVRRSGSEGAQVVAESAVPREVVEMERDRVTLPSSGSNLRAAKRLPTSCLGKAQDIEVVVATIGNVAAASLVLPSSARLAELQERIALILGTPTQAQRLLCGTRALRDYTQCVGDLLENAADGSTSANCLMLTLVKAPSSGSCLEMLALSGAGDCTLRLWDLDWGGTIKDIKAHSRSVRCLAVDWASRRALSGGSDRVLRLWDIAANGGSEALLELEGHEGEVTCVAMDWNSQRAISAGGDRCLRLWDLQSARELQQFWGHRKDVTCLAVDWERERVISGGCDSRLLEFSLSSRGGDIVHYELKGHECHVSCVAADWSSGQVLSGGRNGLLLLWALEREEISMVLRGHSSWVWCVEVDWRSAQALSGSADRSLRLWDLCNGDTTREFIGHSSFVWSVALDWTGLRAVSGSGDGTLRLWDLATGISTNELKGHGSSVRCVAAQWV